MDDRYRLLAAIGLTIALFLGVQLGALALIEPFHETDRHVVENPEDPTHSFVFLAAILVATAVMLAAFRLNATRLIRGFIVIVSGILTWLVLETLLSDLAGITAGGTLALAGGLAVVIGLTLFPEWYVIDITGVIIGAGAAGLFGISLGIFPVLVFLVALAIYDFISVYRTGHMLDLASGVMDLKIPVVFVIPTSLSFSFLELEPVGEDRPSSEETDQDISQPASDDMEQPVERDALFVGLGDAVIPAILVTSAAFFVDAPVVGIPWISVNLPALTAMIGTIAGLCVLLWMVLKGRAHAGLPLLNGGAIAGYLIGALLSGVALTTALGL